MRLMLATFSLLASFAVTANAQTASPKYSDPLALINAGLNAYKQNGPEEAIKTWIRDSPIDNSKDALNQANNMRTVETYYGSYQSAEIIKVRDVSKDVKVIYFVMNYTSGPFFARFMVYHASSGWLLTRFNVNVDDTAVFGDLK